MGRAMATTITPIAQPPDWQPQSGSVASFFIDSQPDFKTLIIQIVLADDKDTGIVGPVVMILANDKDTMLR